MDSERIMEYVDLVSPHPRANLTFKNVIKYIQEFEQVLDDEHEIAIHLATFGGVKAMYVLEVGFHNPDILCFYGEVDGNKAQLIQHVSQLNFLLIAAKKPDPTKEARRCQIIGFHD